MSERASYPAAIKLLHWLTAAVVLAAIPIGITMGIVSPGPAQNQLYDLHRSLGATVLALAALRLAARVTLGAPTPYPGLAPWQRIASTAVHHALYLLLFLVPLLGWAGTSAFGASIVVFGLFELPPILAQDEPLSMLLLGLHKLAALTLTALLSIHILAALMHRLVWRDGVLARMLPSGAQLGARRP